MLLRLDYRKQECGDKICCRMWENQSQSAGSHSLVVEKLTRMSVNYLVCWASEVSATRLSTQCSTDSCTTGKKHTRTYAMALGCPFTAPY